MSKYVKYISSSHYGTPPLKGDRYGYFVELLRSCLCTGFNANHSIISIETIDLINKKISITFNDPHTYSVDQTLLIENIQDFQFNGEYKIIEIIDAVTIITKRCDGIALTTSYSGAPGIAYCKVAPLGFIEAFTSGNISAFTTDEEKAYFVVNDTKPDTWNIVNDYSQLINPLVWMTDKLDNLDSPGKYIVPYLASQPTWYKQQNFQAQFNGQNGLSGNFQRNGLWQMITAGICSASGNNNTDRQLNNSWTLIGNGRLFYFIPSVYNASTTVKKTFIYGFGKINNETTNENLNYILIAQSARYNLDFYNYQQINNNPQSIPLSNVSNYNYAQMCNTDVGNVRAAALKYKNKSVSIVFHPTKSPIKINSSSDFYISGNTYIPYPDPINYRYIISNIYVSAEKGYLLGKLSGFMWTYNIDEHIHYNNAIISYNSINGGSSKKYYVINDDFSINNSNDTVRFVYNISLNDEDWSNYD